MKITTTIEEMIKSELIKKGKNEFHEKNKLTFFSDEHAFIKKMMFYDEDVQEIVNRMFFGNEKLLLDESDINFKKQFVNRFLNRQIAFQTVESFSSQVIYTLLSNYEYINVLFDNLDDFVTGKQTGTDESKGNETIDDRELRATLPQREVNMNVDDTNLNFADENNISKRKAEREDNKESESRNYSIDELIKSNNLIHEMFKIFDKQCFLQIW